MQQQQDEELNVQIIDTTSVLNKLINLNATFDGSNIIYIAGSNIVFHNVFQNTKHFIERASERNILALAFHKAVDVSVAIITKGLLNSNELCFVEFYYHTKKPMIVELGEDIEVRDVTFLQKKKLCILCYDLMNKIPTILIVSSHRKLKRIDLTQEVLKFFWGDRKLLITQVNNGCWQFNPQNESLQTLRHPSIKVKQVFSLQESQIVVDLNGDILVYIDNTLVQTLKVKDCWDGQWGIGVKVGRSLLVAFKDQLVIGHFFWQEGKLHWRGSFEYSERLKANVICMQGSADEMNLVMAVQIFHKESWTIQHFLFNLSALSTQKKFVSAYTRLAQWGSETGEVTSLQKVIPSEVFLLAGPSIVNYSYVEHIQKKHKYVIHESPRLVAVHPLGHQMLCTFEGSVKFYQKIELQLAETWSQAWTCSAAAYTDSGLLFLCIFQQGVHQLILYDPNSFRPLKTYAGLYLKHALTKIEFDQNLTEMILWSGKDVAVYKLKSGEKLSEFREKKQGFDANCVEYDPVRKVVLVGYQGGFTMCRKNEEYNLNFSIQKQITIPEDITCIVIRDDAQTAFLGTQDGKILLAAYPFVMEQETIDDAKIFKIKYKSVRVHSNPTTDLLLTNNGKYIFSVSKREGLAILRVKKGNGMIRCYNPCDLSNYNFIETSSKPYLETAHERLKVLLEKRKAIFNELDQFKKEWEGKRHRESKMMTMDQKKRELQAINSTLRDITITKAEHEDLVKQISRLEREAGMSQAQRQNEHCKNLLQCYEGNDKLTAKLQEAEQGCKDEFAEIEKRCKQNLGQIEGELRAKFQQFRESFELMKSNLMNFGLRREIEDRQERQVRERQVEETRVRLRAEEQQLVRRSNELKGEITRSRKELDRFLNRRDFLENKQRFFRQQLRYCSAQEGQLKEIKEQLQEQLKELQSITYKKEKRLRKYFIENEVLIKYQIIHDNLSKTNLKQIDFIEKQELALRSQINSLQKQILLVSANRQVVDRKIAEQTAVNANVKESLRQTRAKKEYLELQVAQIERLLASVGPDREQQLTGLYERFFVQKRLEGALQSGGGFQQRARVQQRVVQQKIRAQLQAHRGYLSKNMKMFEKFNARAFNEINLSNVKYQGENYALISECNVRKEQIAKKKRILQEMMNSVRETQSYMAQLSQEQPQRPHMRTQPAQPRLQQSRALPFRQYQMQQQQQVLMRRDRSDTTLNRNTGVQVRKMLEVQKLGGPESRVQPVRRIQTANLKKKVVESAHQENMEGSGWLLSKPQTACRRRGAREQAKRLFTRNKSSSKPTTCTSQSKYSLFA